MSRKKTSLAALIPLAIAVVATTVLLPSWAPSPAPAPTPIAPSSTSTPTATPAPPDAAEPSSPANEYTAAAASAAALPLITPEELAMVPEYRRASFGDAWIDIDGNGCRQRDDVLARDLVDVVRDAKGCTVLSGVLEHDPYTGQRIIFQHDRVAQPGNRGSQGVQIEHIVSLKAAHVGGAWAWNPEQRLEFANTLENVIAVDGSANESKGDDGPAEWLPPAETGYLCTYVLKYTHIVQHWGLAVHGADRDALVRTLTACGDPS